MHQLDIQNHNILNNYSLTTKEYLSKIYASQQKFLHAYHCLNIEQQTQLYEMACSNQIVQPSYPFVIQLNQNGLIMVHLGNVQGGMPQVIQAPKASKVSDFCKYNSIAFQNQLNCIQNRSNINLKPIENNYSSVIAIDRPIQSIFPLADEYRAIVYHPNIVVQAQPVQFNQKFQSQTLESDKPKEIPLLKKRIKKTEDDLRNELSNGKDQKETKNIPKNFSKAIINYCQKNAEFCRKLLGVNFNYIDFLDILAAKKKEICNIKELSMMLSDKVNDSKQREFHTAFRKLSSYFLKKHAIGYIFHSRIIQVNWHLKYRRHLMKAVKNPEKFKQIKHMI